MHASIIDNNDYKNIIIFLNFFKGFRFYESGKRTVWIFYVKYLWLIYLSPSKFLGVKTLNFNMITDYREDLTFYL